MRSAKFSNDQGSVVLEFLGFGLMLQIPILIFCTSLIGIQHDQFVAEAITRNALRGLVLTGTPVAQTVQELALEYRIPTARVKTYLTCRPADCTSDGVWMELSTRIGLTTARGVILK